MCCFCITFLFTLDEEQCVIYLHVMDWRRFSDIMFHITRKAVHCACVQYFTDWLLQAHTPRWWGFSRQPRCVTPQSLCSVEGGETILESEEDIHWQDFPGGARGSYSDASRSKAPALSSNTSHCRIDERHTRARAELHTERQKEEEHTMWCTKRWKNKPHVSVMQHILVRLMLKTSHIINYVHERTSTMHLPCNGWLINRLWTLKHL